jgi:hypothetical protein
LQYLFGQMPGSKTTRSLWRKAPAAVTRSQEFVERSLQVFREFLEEKAGQARARSIPLAGQVSGK